MFRNEMKPYDNRPMGLNNPTRLVEHYFPHNAFDVVQQVHFNLGLLKQLSLKMELLQSVGSNLYELQGIQKYLGDIVSVSHNLNNIITVYNNLPVLEDIAPRISAFTSELQCMNTKVEFFEKSYDKTVGELNTKIKYLEDLYVQYECGLKQIIEEQLSSLHSVGKQYLTEFDDLKSSIETTAYEVTTVLPLLKNTKKVQDSIEKRLAHLEATAAISIYIDTQSEGDYRKALAAIKESEEFENDETSNRNRLKNGKHTDVLAVMKKNADNVQIDEDECEVEEHYSCNGGCNV